jgi:hypothetical protein
VTPVKMGTLEDLFDAGYVPRPGGDIHVPPGVYEAWLAKRQSGEASAKPETWCILELMGHLKLAGRLSEEERFGVKLGRIDVPEGDGFMTQYFGGSSVYRITVVSEQVARDVARTHAAPPVMPWDYPRRIGVATPSPGPNQGHYDRQDEEDWEDEDDGMGGINDRDDP